MSPYTQVCTTITCIGIGILPLDSNMLTLSLFPVSQPQKANEDILLSVNYKKLQKTFCCQHWQHHLQYKPFPIYKSFFHCYYSPNVWNLSLFHSFFFNQKLQNFTSPSELNLFLCFDFV